MPAVPIPGVAAATFVGPSVHQWYGPRLLGVSTLAAAAMSPRTMATVADVLARCDQDDYATYLGAFLREGRSRYGEHWRYADILTVLTAASSLLRPVRDLEIGVRRGRSLAMVVCAAPAVDAVGVDMWQAGYAQMENPGPDFVRAEMARLGHRGRLELISGDSHEVLPRLFRERPEHYFDIITVDGDHSEAGAAQDLRDVRDRVALGGVLVFDDIASPYHPELLSVWQREIGTDPRYQTWTFEELGFGVAVGLRVKA